MTLTDLALDAGAVARLTRLATVDDITDPIRGFVHSEAALADWSGPWQFVDDALACRWCTAIWVAGLVTVVRMATPRLWTPVAWLLAISHGAGLVRPTQPHPGAFER